VLAVGIAWLYFFAGAYYGIYVSEVRISSLVIAGLVLGAWGVAAWRSDRWAPRSAIWPAIAASLGALAVSTILSRNPRISLDFLAYAVLLWGLYLLLRALLVDPAIRPRMGAAMIILGVVLGVAYLAACMLRWLPWWELVGRLAIPPMRPWYEGLTYGNPGLVAAMAALTWLAAVGHLGLGSRWARLVAVLLGLLAVVVIVVSGTRGAWLAVAATLVAGLGLALARDEGRRAASLAMRSTASRVIVLAVVAVGAALVAVGGPLIADRFVTSGEGGRTAYWAASVRMFADAPLTGVGPGMWAPQRIVHTEVPELDFYIPHAHNLYVQVAADLGVVGILAGLVIVVVVGRLVLNALRGPDVERRWWAAVAILATVYLGTHQLFDLYVNMPAALFAFVLPFAWLDATVQEGATRLTRVPAIVATGRRGLVPVGLLVVIAAVGWGLWSERSALDFGRSQGEADGGDWAASLVAAEEAVVLDSSLAPHWLASGLAKARTGDAAGGLADLEQAASLDDLPTAWLNLAWLRAQSGDVAGAREALDRSLRLGEQQAAVALAAGYVHETLGDVAESDARYAGAVRVLPRLAGDLFWAQPTRTARWAGIREAALAGLDPASQVDLWLSEGELGKAAEAAAAVEAADQRQVLGLVVAAWGGDSTARTSLEALLDERPRDGWLAGWCARVAAHDGDTAAAADFRSWANTVSIFSGLLGFEVEVVDDLEPGAPIAGATWLPYGIYAYRRPTLANHLLPGLPHIQWVERR
jgi:tetratricopeptide (TPR) repeat protein